MEMCVLVDIRGPEECVYVCVTVCVCVCACVRGPWGRFHRRAAWACQDC